MVSANRATDPVISTTISCAIAVAPRATRLILTARIPSVLASRADEILYAGRVLMVVITSRSVTVPRSLIVHVTAIVAVVDRRVLVAGLTTFGVGPSHGRQLSQRCVVATCSWWSDPRRRRG